MTDKDLIKNEVKKIQTYAKTIGDNAINSSMQQFYDGMKQCCVNILSFIDSLPSKDDYIEGVTGSYTTITK